VFFARKLLTLPVTGVVTLTFASSRTSRSSSLPPTIILHGKADTIVPYADVERFCTQAKSRGLPCELVGYEGAPHGFFRLEKDEHGRQYGETLVEADRFLTRIGYLQGPAPTQIP
jgi:acetyl esterase